MLETSPVAASEVREEVCILAAGLFAEMISYTVQVDWAVIAGDLSTHQIRDVAGRFDGVPDIMDPPFEAIMAVVTGIMHPVMVATIIATATAIPKLTALASAMGALTTTTPAAMASITVVPGTMVVLLPRPITVVVVAQAATRVGTTIAPTEALTHGNPSEIYRGKLFTRDRLSPVSVPACSDTLAGRYLARLPLWQPRVRPSLTTLKRIQRNYL